MDLEMWAVYCYHRLDTWKHISASNETIFLVLVLVLVLALVKLDLPNALAAVNHLRDIDVASYPDDHSLEANYFHDSRLENHLSRSDVEEVVICLDESYPLVDHHARYLVVHEIVMSRDVIYALGFPDVFDGVIVLDTVAWEIHLSIGGDAVLPSPLILILIFPFFRCVGTLSYFDALVVTDFASLGIYCVVLSALFHHDIDSSPFP